MLRVVSFPTGARSPHLYGKAARSQEGPSPGQEGGLPREGGTGRAGRDRGDSLDPHKRKTLLNCKYLPNAASDLFLLFCPTVRRRP